MKKWERIVKVSRHTSYPEMSKMEDLGYQLIAIVPIPKLAEIQYYRFYFKREVETKE